MNSKEIEEAQHDLRGRLYDLHNQAIDICGCSFKEFLKRQKLWFLLSEERFSKENTRPRSAAVWNSIEAFRKITPSDVYFVKGTSTGLRYYNTPEDRFVTDIDIIANPSKVMGVYQSLLENGCEFRDPKLSQVVSQDSLQAISATLKRAMMVLHELPLLTFNGTLIDVNFRVLLRGTALYEKSYGTASIEKKFWTVVEEKVSYESSVFPLEIDAIYMILHYFSEFFLNEFEPPETCGIRLHKLADLYFFARSSETNWPLFWNYVERIGCQKIVGEISQLLLFVFGPTSQFLDEPASLNNIVSDISIMKDGETRIVEREDLFMLMQMNVIFALKNSEGN